MRRKPRMIFAAVAVTGLIAAACSSGSDSTVPTTQAPEPTAVPTTEAAPAASQSIAEIVSSSEGFSTLLAAVEAAGLTGTLDTGGPFTVFAPTDDAFAELPEGTVEGLLENVEALTNVLLYHVVEGAVPAEDIVNLSSATTLQGSDIAISIDNGVFLNEDSMAVATNILATNGIIHVIDAVLLPPGA